MKWVELKVLTSHASAEAVSGIFYELGCGGVVVEDPDLARRCIARGEWDAYELPTGFLDRDYVVVTAYFPEPGPDTDLLEKRLVEVEQYSNDKCELVVGSVDEEDWANFWKEFYHTQHVGQNLWIKPSWEEFAAPPGAIVLEIDPGMAFGTGTHATTRFCLELMEDRLQEGIKVLDIGTGSGILAIAAAKLGAKEVTAVDLDVVAVDAARANVCLNHVDDTVKVRQMDFLSEPYHEKVDLVISNITAEIISRMLDKVAAALKEGGLFILSGVIESKWPELLEKLNELGFELIEAVNGEEWVGAVLRKERTSTVHA